MKYDFSVVYIEMDPEHKKGGLTFFKLKYVLAVNWLCL